MSGPKNDPEDPYEVQLDSAMENRGLHRASYVAGIEAENLEMRKLLMESRHYLPPHLKLRMRYFFAHHKENEKENENDKEKAD